MSSKGLRKPHTKSRKGCNQCKQKHQKCNEQHPQCSNCERLDIPCSFTRTPPPPQSRSPSLAQAISSSSPEAPLPLADLELLYNYMTNTANAFWFDSTRLQIFREKYIQLGFTHTYVLHGALACSALHLYSKDRNRHDLLTAASAHQASALRQVQPVISNLSEKDSIPVFVFSTYTSLFAQAEIAVRLPKPNSDAIGDWLSCTYLVRGVMSVVGPFHQRLLSTWISPVLVFEQTEDVVRPTVEKDYGVRMRPLYDLADLETEEDRSACRQAIDSCFLYTAVFDACPDDDNSFRLVPTWPIKLEPRFLEMIAARHPTALIILAYYAILIQKRYKAWWLHGWPEYLLQGIEGIVGDSELLRWPKETILGQS